MKKLNVFLVVAFSIIVLYCFPSFAEKIYPPGEIYAIEAITTDSYPDMRKRAEMQRDHGSKTTLVGDGNIQMEVIQRINGNI